MDDNKNVYVRLIINHSKRTLLGMICVGMWVCFFVLISNSMQAKLSWVIPALPVCGIGLLCLLLGPTEIWDYQPWQTKARQYERHQFEKQ